jgi:hypothetical protein
MRVYDFCSGVTEDSVLLGCDTVSVSEQFPDVSKDHSFLMFKGLDARVIWTLEDKKLECFEILGSAHPVIWCGISEACIPEMQII